jgi:hypothetical protein
MRLWLARHKKDRSKPADGSCHAALPRALTQHGPCPPFSSQVNGELKDLGKECDSVRDNMKELKTKLYSKFGSSINL